VIRLENVSKAYKVGKGRRVVLQDVSVTFPTGRSIGILGLNGAGKSTLLRLIGGVEPPDRGRITRDIRVSWPIGFGGGVHNSMTGRENARFIARIYGEAPREIEKFTEEFTELGPYFDQPVITYSSGMRARLAFGISMAAKFDCYLVDEVTAVGDKRFSHKYREAFRQRLKHASVVMVSHNPGTIRAECDMGAVLSRGKIEIYDTVNEAMQAYTVVT